MEAEAEADIEAEICAAGEVNGFESKYEYDHEIRCTIRNCRQPHKRGFFVRLRNGRIARIGNICGKRLLGDETFVRMQNDLEHRLRRARREKFISSPNFDPVAALAKLTGWRHNIQIIEVTRENFRISANWLLLDLVAAARNMEGRLMERGAGIGNDRVFHTIEGRQWLVDSQLNATFTQASNLINHIRAATEKVEWSDDELAGIVADAERAVYLLRMVADALDDYRAFATNQNLRGITRWVHHRGWRAKVTPEGLELDFITIRVLPAAGAVDRSPIEHLRPRLQRM